MACEDGEQGFQGIPYCPWHDKGRILQRKIRRDEKVGVVMTEKMVPCKYCKCQKAETFKVGDLWYVRCRGSKKTKDGSKQCSSWGPYEFLGLKEKDAIDNWNERNSKG